jgi:hypothetical protein
LGQIPLPVNFNAPKIQLAPGGSIWGYRIPICAGVAGAYNGMTLELAAEIPQNQWNPTRGYWIKMVVYTDPSMRLTSVVCSNEIAKVSTCSFMYNSNYTDLYVVATAGAVAAVNFVINAEFQTDHAQPNWAAVDHSQWLVEPAEIPAYPGAPQWTDMTQTARKDGIVQTDDVISFTTYICPSPGTVQSTIAVGIVAADDKSGFFTWLCYQNPDDCNALDFDAADLSGAGVNSLLVTVPATFPNVTIAITGFGQYAGMNKLLLGISKAP